MNLYSYITVLYVFLTVIKLNNLLSIKCNNHYIKCLEAEKNSQNP